MPGTEPKPFCGIAMSLAEYDDARAFRAYVWKHYRHLMTPLERRVTEYTVPLVSGATDFKCQRLYAFLEDRDGYVADSDVREAFKQPYDTRKDAAIDRVIANVMTEVLQNATSSPIGNRFSACRCEHLQPFVFLARVRHNM